MTSLPTRWSSWRHPRAWTHRTRRRGWPLPEAGAGVTVVALGLLSALAWGTGDFGGGLLSRRAPLFAVVLGIQAVGMAAAALLAVVRGEPFPQDADVAWSVAAGVAGVVGISSLYRGLAMGRMGVVAPTTGVLAAVVPVLFGFGTEGVPPPPVVTGIVVALLAVVLVTRAPGHGDDRPSGIEWALLGGLAIGAFNVCIGQLSGTGAFAPLALMRLVQILVLCGIIVAWRQPWRMNAWAARRLIPVGLLDMTGNVAFILAAQAGALAIAAVLSSLYPVVTVLLAIAVLKERLTRSHVAGVALTVVAIALIGFGSAGA